jgi:polysaccharide export outer membrane protein
VVQKAALSGQRDALVEAPATAVARLPPAAANLTAVAEPGHVAYRIGPLDVLTVTVFRVPELSAEVQVADTGTINLPLIGDVQAAGRTAKDVEKEVTAKLGEKYLQNPQVTVFIKEYNAQRVTVNGAVKKPGVFPLKGRTTLLQLISMAEGLDHNRASSNVVVFRNSNGKRTAARFDLDQIHDGTAEDPTLQPGDIVVVDDSSAKILWQNLLRALPITNVFTAVL